jgi:hypothetical protein
MQRKRIVKQWQNLSAVIALAFMLNVQSALGQVKSRSIYPAPIIVPSSESWLFLPSNLCPDSTDTTRDGNDGPWSSFVFQIGTPPQTVKLLPSTASYETWAIDPQGCQPGDLTNCQTLRGELYNYNASSSWDPNLSNTTTDIYPLELEAALGYTGKGRYGFDDVTLGYIGSGGLTLKNQSITTVATKSFFMGLFGLTPRSKNFTNFNDPIPSFMQSLRNQSKIPSLSWGYTAGNQYSMFHSSIFLT